MNKSNLTKTDLAVLQTILEIVMTNDTIGRSISRSTGIPSEEMQSALDNLKKDITIAP